ncbi:MAG: PD40 domain-containing protein [Enhydrobacter sp.]|nr:MAG: PD40 domain-containing protein [Enhydrobacter sp.]
MKYDAFISYSHSADGRLAPRLQRALHRFAKPWWKRRALAVFRDETDLAASSSLNAIILQALDQARYFVFLASPRAAASKWCRGEVEHWLKRRSTDGLLIVLTDGRMRWDDAAGDFDWTATDALPPEMVGKFAGEPFWLDLSWVRGADQLSEREPRFQQVVAKLAATLHGKSLADISGEDVRQHRRTRRIAGAAAVGLFVLAIAATAGGLFAWQQMRLAEDRLAEALASGSRVMAQTAQAMIARGDHGAALALALEALPRHVASPDRPYVAEAEAALRQALRGLHEERILGRADAPLLASAVSPDGTWLAVSSGRDVHLWSISGKAESLVLRGHADDVLAIAFAADGRTIVTAGGKQALLWQARDGRLLGALGGHRQNIRDVAVSPDGRRVLTGSFDGTARLWDVETRRLVLTLDGHGGLPVNIVRFAVDGRSAFTAGFDGTLRRWTLADGAERALMKGHEQGDGPHFVLITSLALSPDGKHVLTTGFDRTARVWEAETGRQLRVLEGHESAVFSAAFSPDGRHVVAASQDGTARLWDLEGDETTVLEGHDGSVQSVAFSPDGTMIGTASADRTARLWDRRGTSLATLGGHELDVSWIAFVPEARRVITSSRDGTARIWRQTPAERATAFGDEATPIRTVAYAPDGTRAAAVSPEQKVSIASLPDWIVEGELGIGHDEYWPPVFSPDGRLLLTRAGFGRGRLWNVADRRPAGVLAGYNGQGVFSPDGRTIAGAAKGEPAVEAVGLWDAETGKTRLIVEGHREGITGLAFSPDGSKLASRSSDGLIILRDSSSGRVLASIRGHDKAPNDSDENDGEMRVEISSLSFSPDGKRLLTSADDRTARLWDAATGAPLAVLKHSAPVTGASFSPDGGIVVTVQHHYGYDEPVQLWHADSARLLRGLRHEKWVARAVFMPDGRRLVTSATDARLRVWDIESGSLIDVLPGFAQDYAGLAIGPRGQFIATWDGETSGMLWPYVVSTQALVDKACAALPALLPPTKRAALFLPPRPITPLCPERNLTSR